MGRQHTVKTKMIDGVRHRKCYDCRVWVLWPERGKVARCEYHQRIYQDEQNRKTRIRRAKEGQNEKAREFRVKPIPQDFTAANRISGLWSGVRCEKLKIAMLQGDFNTFMRLTG